MGRLNDFCDLTFESYSLNISYTEYGVDFLLLLLDIPRIMFKVLKYLL